MTQGEIPTLTSRPRPAVTVPWPWRCLCSVAGGLIRAWKSYGSRERRYARPTSSWCSDVV